MQDNDTMALHAEWEVDMVALNRELLKAQERTRQLEQLCKAYHTLAQHVTIGGQYRVERDRLEQAYSTLFPE